MTVPARDSSFIAFDDLLNSLRRHGFKVGVDHYVRLYDLLPKLSGSCTPNELKRLLCPLFATSREEQEQFYWIFDEHYELLNIEDADAAIAPISQDGRSLRTLQGLTRSLSVRLQSGRWLWIIAGTLALIDVIETFDVRRLAHARGGALWLLIGSITTYWLVATVLVTWIIRRRAAAEPPAVEAQSATGLKRLLRALQQPVSLRAMVVALVALVVLAETVVWVRVHMTATEGTATAIATDTLTGSRLAPPETSSSSTVRSVQSPSGAVPRSLPDSTGIFGTTPHDATARSRTSFVLLAIAILGFVEVRQYRRRQLVLQREQGRRPPLVWPVKVPGSVSVYRGSADMRLAARSLRRRESSELARLSMEESIAATIEAGGYPTLRFRSDTRPSEYLMLIDRRSLNDHAADLFTDLCSMLQSEGVHIVRYYFNRDPRTCFEDYGGPGILMLDLKRRFPSHRALVFSDGDGLIEPVTGRLQSWAGSFLGWGQRVLFTTVATQEWGQREVTLAKHFLVLPASAAALRAAFDFFAGGIQAEQKSSGANGTEPLIDDESALDFDSLRVKLGPAVFDWLCACAIYSELQWDLTLHLAAIMPRGEGLVTERNLLHLLRLPWFRQGSMPTEIRAVLVKRLDPRVAASARQAILALLEGNPPPSRTAVSNRHQLEIAAHRSALLGTSLFGWRSINGEQAHEARGLRQALTRLRFSGETPRSTLDLVLPSRFKRTFNDQSAPLFTRGSAVRLSLGLSLTATLLIALNLWDREARAVQASAAAAVVQAGMLPAGNVDFPPIEALRKLDTVRAQLDTLSDYEHHSSPLSLRRRLQSDSLFAAVRGAYFAAFNRVMFTNARANLLRSLRGLPESAQASGDYSTSYSLLKAYLVTTRYPERSTVDFLSPVLMRLWLNGRTIDSARAVIAQRQFDTYARELPFGNPFPPRVDSVAVERVRTFLSPFAGSESIYELMIAEANKASQPIQFNRLYPGSERYLVNAYQVPGAYTKAGFTFMQSAFSRIGSFLQGESWVLGEGARPVNKAQVYSELGGRYANDYIGHWWRFLQSSSIVRYANLRDASFKLSVLSGNQSPLLTLFSIVSRNTNVAPEIASVFAPVQRVMPADTMRLIGPENQAYLNALGGFQAAVDQAGGSTGSQQGPNAETAARVAKTVVGILTESRLRPDQQGQVESFVQKLMEDPISNAEPLLAHLGADQVNARARNFCAGARVTLQKFPFNPSSTAQASIPEVTALLRPGSGSLWTMYSEVLQSSLQKQGNAYQPVQGDVRLLPGFVDMFNRLAAFSDILFAGGTPDPKMEFSVRPLFAEGTNGVQLQLEGDLVEVRESKLSYARTIDWPASTHDSRLSILLGVLQANLVGPYDGQWATFQVFYAADSWQQVGPISRAEWVLRSGTQGISLPGGALKVSVEVTPVNAANVLHRGYFSGISCGEAAR